MYIDYNTYYNLVNMAYDVFNIYNGICNTINKNIEFSVTTLTNSDVFGLSQYNKVTLYLNTCIEYSNTINTIKINIINTIIHELYHLDQKLNMNIYNENDKYKDNVELDVINRSKHKIYEDIDMISNRYNIPKPDIDKFFNTTNYKFNPNIHINNQIKLVSRYATNKEMYDYSVFNIARNTVSINIILMAKNIHVSVLFNNNKDIYTVKENNEYNIDNLYKLINIIKTPYYGNIKTRVLNDSLYIFIYVNKFNIINIRG